MLGMSTMLAASHNKAFDFSRGLFTSGGTARFPDAEPQHRQ